MKPSPRSSGSRSLSGMQILFASILAIGLLLAINFSNRITAGQRSQQIREELGNEIATLEAEQVDLEAEVSYVRSDQYVESWARSQGKMARPDEVLVIPVPGGVPLATPTPPPPTPPADLFVEEEPMTEDWRLWWALFFDAPPPF